jgi:hypothetical protein
MFREGSAKSSIKLPFWKDGKLLIVSVEMMSSFICWMLRTSGLSYGKKSFLNLEVNLYTNQEMDFKSQEIKESVKIIIKNIFNNAVENNKYFDFSISKNDEI